MYVHKVVNLVTVKHIFLRYLTNTMNEMNEASILSIIRPIWSWRGRKYEPMHYRGKRSHIF